MAFLATTVNVSNLANLFYSDLENKIFNGFLDDLKQTSPCDALKPCLNGGMCSNKSDGKHAKWECDCAKGFDGGNCQCELLVLFSVWFKNFRHTRSSSCSSVERKLIKGF